jgi:hypothetical protein
MDLSQILNTTSPFPDIQTPFFVKIDLRHVAARHSKDTRVIETIHPAIGKTFSRREGIGETWIPYMMQHMYSHSPPIYANIVVNTPLACIRRHFPAQYYKSMPFDYPSPSKTADLSPDKSGASFERPERLERKRPREAILLGC